MPQIEQPLGRMLSLLGKGYLHLLQSKLQHLDIDRNYYALVLIENNDGILSQQELALLLDSDKVSIVRIVDYLAGKGYVKRQRKTEDKRKHFLVLTDTAKKALPEIRRSFKEINDIALQGLDKSQIEALSEIIQKIKSNITDNIQAL
jgi:MarR family transcriptional regulator, transcriptional regulator for hemolysin